MLWWTSVRSTQDANVMWKEVMEEHQGNCWETKQTSRHGGRTKNCKLTGSGGRAGSGSKPHPEICGWSRLPWRAATTWPPGSTSRSKHHLQSFFLCSRNPQLKRSRPPPKGRTANLQTQMTFLLVCGRCWEIAALPSYCVFNQVVARNKLPQTNSFHLEIKGNITESSSYWLVKLLSHSTAPPCWWRNIQNQQDAPHSSRPPGGVLSSNLCNYAAVL